MINSLRDLAVFGAPPFFKKPLCVGTPNIGNRTRLFERIGALLDRRQLTNNGPFVQELEQKLAEYLGVRHCIAICNGTLALQIVCRAVGLEGEVILPSFTFIATAHALNWQNLTPVFCDVEETHHIDPGEIRKRITPRTSGILGVHIWGQACNIAAIRDIAEQHKLRVIYDAAHALGCSYSGQMIGGFGDAEVFSFHATKFFHTFEGGAITTNNDHLAEKIRLIRNFGFVGYDDVRCLGINGKMSEVSAAMGLTLLESIDDILETNLGNYEQYTELLANVPGLKMLAPDKNEKSNYQYVVVELDEAFTGIHRDDLLRVLHAENVLARRYFYPGCHRMEPYRSIQPDIDLWLPNTNRLISRVFSLPTGTSVSPEEISRVCEIIRFAVSHGKDITLHLQNSSMNSSK